MNSNNDNNLNLKPCPFCGSTVAPRFIDWKEDIIHPISNVKDDDMSIKVECCTIRGGCGASTMFTVGMKNAVKEWNKRWIN